MNNRLANYFKELADNTYDVDNMVCTILTEVEKAAQSGLYEIVLPVEYFNDRVREVLRDLGFHVYLSFQFSWFIWSEQVIVVNWRYTDA